MDGSAVVLLACAAAFEHGAGVEVADILKQLLQKANVPDRAGGDAARDCDDVAFLKPEPFDIGDAASGREGNRHDLSFDLFRGHRAVVAPAALHVIPLCLTKDALD